MEDVWDTGDEDEATYDRRMAEIEQRRLEDQRLAAGYREAAGQAHEQALQKGFDRGYAVGVKAGLELGRMRGVAWYKPPSSLIPHLLSQLR